MNRVRSVGPFLYSLLKQSFSDPRWRLNGPCRHILVLQCVAALHSVCCITWKYPGGPVKVMKPRELSQKRDFNNKTCQLRNSFFVKTAGRLEPPGQHHRPRRLRSEFQGPSSATQHQQAANEQSLLRCTKPDYWMKQCTFQDQDQRYSTQKVSTVGTVGTVFIPIFFLKLLHTVCDEIWAEEMYSTVRTLKRIQSDVIVTDGCLHRFCQHGVIFKNDQVQYRAWTNNRVCGA